MTVGPYVPDRTGKAELRGYLALGWAGMEREQWEDQSSCFLSEKKYEESKGVLRDKVHGTGKNSASQCWGRELSLREGPGWQGGRVAGMLILTAVP